MSLASVPSTCPLTSCPTSAKLARPGLASAYECITKSAWLVEVIGFNCLLLRLCGAEAVLIIATTFIGALCRRRALYVVSSKKQPQHGCGLRTRAVQLFNFTTGSCSCNGHATAASVVCTLIWLQRRPVSAVSGLSRAQRQDHACTNMAFVMMRVRTGNGNSKWCKRRRVEVHLIVFCSRPRSPIRRHNVTATLLP
jgi:hypothetical protein